MTNSAENSDPNSNQHSNHQHFMRRAIELSLQNVAVHGGGPFGAVVVQDGVIVGEGWNQVTANNDPTAHAEINAIRAACKTVARFDLRGASIYTSCEPCPMCLAAIYWARLDAIFYANTKLDAAAIQFDDNFIYQQLSKPVDERSIPMTQLLRDEASAAFVLWRNNASKTPY